MSSNSRSITPACSASRGDRMADSTAPTSTNDVARSGRMIRKRFRRRPTITSNPSYSVVLIRSIAGAHDSTSERTAEYSAQTAFASNPMCRAADSIQCESLCSTLLSDGVRMILAGNRRSETFRCGNRTARVAASSASPDSSTGQRTSDSGSVIDHLLQGWLNLPHTPVPSAVRHSTTSAATERRSK